MAISLSEEVAEPLMTLPLGRLQTPTAFGANFTEALAGDFNRLIEVFNSLSNQDRGLVYEDLMAPYNEERNNLAVMRLNQGVTLKVFDLGNVPHLIFLIKFFNLNAVELVAGEAVSIKTIDLIVA